MLVFRQGSELADIFTSPLASMNDDISLEPPLAMLQPFPYDNSPSIPFMDDSSPAKPLTSDNSSKEKPAAQVCRLQLFAFQTGF